jgi:hypothetical protein
VTFAAAALHSRIKVILFEKEGVLLPLQTGCSTRFIHPNIYSWPVSGSSEKQTSLPVLNWEADRADVVADKISNEFQDIRKFYEQRGLNFDNYYNQTLNSGNIIEIIKNSSGKWSVTTDKGCLMACDVLVYAVGFGVENSELEHTMSYWRCTDISQEPEPSAEYLISGVGDGAFIDLITALIRDFDYDRVTGIIAEKELLIKNLEDSRIAFFDALAIEKKGGEPVPKDFIYKEFEGLRARLYDHILDKLDIRQFPIVLHSRKPFAHIFDISKVSMLNAFLVFLLRGKFTYHEGEYTYDRTMRFFSLNTGDYTHGGDRIFFRHGTNREKLLTDIPGLTDKIKTAELKKQQESGVHDGDIQKLWQDEDFNKRFEQSYYEEIPYVSGNALQCLETFIRGLSEQLRVVSPENTVFRVTLHKVLGISNKLYYQQVTPYYGHPPMKADGGFGRIFSWNTGSVGYSILKSKPLLLLKKGNETEYRQILEQLALTGKTEDLVNSAKTSFFSLPFLAKTANGESVTNFILYIDSENADFFTEKAFDAVLAASVSFAASFESLVAKGQLSRGSENYNPYEFLNEDDKKLFHSITNCGAMVGDSSDPYQTFVKKLRKKPIAEFMAFNWLTN